MTTLDPRALDWAADALIEAEYQDVAHGVQLTYAEIAERVVAAYLEHLGA